MVKSIFFVMFFFFANSYCATRTIKDQNEFASIIFSYVKNQKANDLIELVGNDADIYKELEKDSAFLKLDQKYKVEWSKQLSLMYIGDGFKRTLAYVASDQYEGNKKIQKCNGIEFVEITPNQQKVNGILFYKFNVVFTYDSNKYCLYFRAIKPDTNWKLASEISIHRYLVNMH